MAKKAEVHIAFNGSQAQNGLKDLDRLALMLEKDLEGMAQELKDIELTLGAQSKEYKALNRTIHETEQRMKAYTTATDVEVEKTKKLADVVADLANTKLRDLKRAMGQGKSMIQGLTGSDEDLRKAEQIRKDMKTVMDQARLIEGEYVKISNVVDNLGNVSDKVLSKAIKQQQEDVAWIDRSNDSYQKELAILKQLEAEEAKRKVSSANMTTVGAKSIATDGGYHNTQTNAYQNASLNDMRQARSILTNLRDNATDTGDIKQYNDLLAQLDIRMKALAGDTEKALLTQQRYDEILANVKDKPLEDLKKASQMLVKELEKLPPASKDAEVLRKKLKEIDREIKQVADDAVDVGDVIERSKKGKASIAELKQAYKQLEEELQNIENTTGSTFKDKQRDLQDLKKKIDDATGAVHKQGGAWQTAMKNLVAYVGLFGAFNMVKQKLTDVITLNLKFSDQLADIRKVSGLAMRDINDLARGLAKIDTRTTIEELNKIAYSGAKLGIGNYGSEGLEQFARAANQVNVALKEDLGEEALSSLSKITEVMGLIPKMGVEQSMLKTGSAMFKLSSTSTATSANIVEFSKRLLSLSKTAGLTTADLLALGSASDSMALMPEVASTAFNKLLTQLKRAPGSIEQSLKMTKGELSDLMSKGKGMEAILLVLQKMHDSGNVFAMENLFKDLGSDGARLINVMVTMSKNVDMLRKHVDTSNEAFKEGAAISQEYQIQQNTANALMERASNMWEKAFVNPNQVDVVRQMAKAWYDVTKAVTESGDTMKGLHLIINGIIASLKIFIVSIPYLVAGLGIGGLVGAVGAAINAVRSLGGVMTALNYAMLSLRSTFMGLSVIVRFTWAGMALGTLISLISYFDLFGKKLSQTSNYMKGFKKEVDAMDGSLRKTEPAARQLAAAIQKANKGTNERAALIKQFNSQYGTYIKTLLTEKSTALEVAAAYAEVVKQLKLKSLAELKQKDYDNYVTPAYGWEATRLNTYGKMGGNAGWLKGVVADGQKNATSLQTLIGNIAQKLGVSASFAQEAYKMRSDATVATKSKQVTKSVDRGDGISETVVVTPSRAYTEKERKLIAAAQYATQVYSTANREKAVDKKWKPYEKDFEQIATVEEETEMSGAGITKDKQSLTNPDDEARNHIAQFLKEIEEYYTRQKNEAINRMTADGVEKALQDATVDDIDARMQLALNAARTAIVKENNAWTQFRDSMQKDLLESPDENGWSRSQDLLTKLLGTDATTFGKELDVVLAKIKHSKKEGDKIIGYKPEDSDELLRARLLHQNAQGANVTARKSQRRQEAMRKDLLEHDYTGTVQDNSFVSLVSDGFANVNAMSADFSKQKETVISVLEKSREEIVAVLASKGDKSSLMKTLFGETWKQAIGTSQFAPLLNMEGKEFQLFYQKLLQYSDEYTQAQKKQYDEQKKVVEMQWKLSGRDKSQADRQRELNRFNSIYGEQNTFSSALGFSNKAYDPEVESYKLKLQLAKEYYEYVMETSNNAQLQKEAEMSVLEAQNALTEKMVSAMKERMNKVREFAQPIVDFGAAAGEALGQMTDDVESAQEAMKNAVKSMLKSWGQMMINNFVGQMTQSMNNVQAKKISDAQTATTPFTSAPTPDMAVEMTAGTSPDDPLYVSVTNGALGEGNTGGTSAEGGNATVTVGARNGGEGGESGGRSSIVRAGKETASDAVTQAMSGGDMNTLAASVLGSGVTAALNTPIGGKSDKSSKQQAKDAKKQIQDAQKQQKDLTNIAEQGEKSRTRIEQQGTSERSDIQENGAKIEQQVATAAGSALLSSAMATQQQETAIEGAGTQVRTQMSIVEAMAKCFAFLGPIAGPIAASAVQALLMGLLNWAISAAFGGSSESSSSSTPSTKLVSGMLTYDKGNLQQLYIGNDGRIYSAQEQREGLSTGIVDHPIATTVNGQPALVGEQGPELVVGRETTAAMMHNAPQLLQMLLQFDKNRTMQGMGGSMGLFDAGNVQQVLGEQNIGNGTQDNAALVSVLAQMHTLLQTLNRDGVKAQMNMYGRNGAYSQMQRATTFMKGR